MNRQLPTQPYSFEEAVAACRRAAEAQKEGEQAVREASTKLAEAERAYRLALAKEIVTQHADGGAWTVAQDLARGQQHVADLRYTRDVAKGVLDAAEQRAWRHTADRKDVLELVQWSRIVAPLGQTDEPPGGDVAPIGSRRAA